jgi:hypothetical protein
LSGGLKTKLQVRVETFYMNTLLDLLSKTKEILGSFGVGEHSNEPFYL